MAEKNAIKVLAWHMHSAVLLQEAKYCKKIVNIINSKSYKTLTQII